MIRIFLAIAFILETAVAHPQSPAEYKSLDTANSIAFRGDHLLYNGKKILLNDHAFFVDGQLPDTIASKYSHVYNSVNKAAQHLRDGSEDSPMVIYLAPWVYWIDNPDDTAVRVPTEGSTPYGLTIKCEWLRFEGLTSNPENVVLASNRGQTIGAKGNFTMFRFIGQGTSSANITFGNYCNVDLVFPLKPALNRTKRASAIVQAQLIHCNGDKIIARNTRFISRLNLCPFVGGKRVLFDDCYFESTDDALCGTGVYLNSKLQFYSSKPFYRTTGTGAVLLNCDITSFAGKQQFFTKAGGQVALVDSRFTSSPGMYWGWQDVVPRDSKNYQLNLNRNEMALKMSAKDPMSTVDMLGKPLEFAYRFLYDGGVFYNTYNLLRGDDEWDPMNIKSIVEQAALVNKTALSNLPVQLVLSSDRQSIETGKSELVVTAKAFRFGGYASPVERLTWSVSPAYKSFVKLIPGEASCRVIPANIRDTSVTIVIQARTASGLEAATIITVAPAIMVAPAFIKSPSLKIDEKGMARVSYTLNTKFADQSDIRWYRCLNSDCSKLVEVAVSRFNKPLQQYQLTACDSGYRIMVTVSPKHIRSKKGQMMKAFSAEKISAKQIKQKAAELQTDFRNFSTRNQPEIIPGFWTLRQPIEPGIDARLPIDTSRDAWYFGAGEDGAANMIGLLQGRSASLYYNPVSGQSGNMKISLRVAPFKTAGQGFSVAHLYMDVLIGFDAEKQTGYALRFIRTTKFGDAVDCMMMQYQDGKIKAISEAISTRVFRTLCTIDVELHDKKISALVRTTANAIQSDTLPNQVKLEAGISGPASNGFGIEYHGGSPTMIKDLRISWYK